MPTRRDFLQNLAAGSATLAMAANAKSYAQIMGANSRVNFAVCGLNGRGKAHLSALKANAATSRLATVCDPDATVLKSFAGLSEKTLGYGSATEQDFRHILADKNIDAITIATPDHWHAPMGIMAMQAGKNVYVEKPCSFNPSESEMIIAVQKKTGKVCQMGSQQRSSPHTIEIVGKIHDGLIGEATNAQTWYINNRKATHYGPGSTAPATLLWDVWQGPAPHKPYREGIHPYNWHWLRNYGTGESLNNGSHEIDVARWALGVEYPTRVSASGGNYQFKDDWQFYDTMNASFEYGDSEPSSGGKLITWAGYSRQPMRMFDRERGVLVRGTRGSVIIDRDGYDIFDEGNKKTGEFRVSHNKTSTSDTIGADSMTDAHFANFIGGITRGEKLKQPIESGAVCCTMLHLANISWETQRTLKLDPATAHILDDKQAAAMTHREYEKGWEPKV